jgi:hypothetical protein
VPIEYHENNKHQKTNIKQIPMTQIQNSKHDSSALRIDNIFVGGKIIDQRYVATAANVLVIEN